VNPGAIDPAAFAHLREITGDDLDFLDELIDTYLEDGAVQLEAMTLAGRTDDVEAMIRPAHSLKSSSANVGAAALTDLCQALEADARSGTIADATDRVSACRRAFDDVRAALLAERAGRG
jgi:HPt (histidine-containing phosphotransfer) domain-containing protein